MTHIMTITCPKAFKDGPQFDDDGLIPGSWPTPFPTEGLVGWIAHGTVKQNRVLVDAVIEDEHIDTWLSLPNGWTKASHHSWDMRSGDEYDEDGNLISHGLETHTATDKAEYEKHMPEVDGNPQTYKRQHVIFGWPEIHD